MLDCDRRDFEDRIEQLEEQVAFWKNEAMQSADSRAVATLRDRFGLTPSEAWLLATLHAARGKVVRRVLLQESLPKRHGRDREDEANLVAVYVVRIRQKIGAAAILTHRTTGYAIGPAALERCDAILKGDVPCSDSTSRAATKPTPSTQAALCSASR